MINLILTRLIVENTKKMLSFSQEISYNKKGWGAREWFPIRNRMTWNKLVETAKKRRFIVYTTLLTSTHNPELAAFDL
jgi:hypothetical protein